MKCSQREACLKRVKYPNRGVIVKGVQQCDTCPLKAVQQDNRQPVFMNKTIVKG